MTQKPETRLHKAILSALRERYGKAGKWVKIHGGAMQESGLPDINGCLRGRTVVMEVKMPGEEATPIQAFRLQEYADAGATVGVVVSVEQALALADASQRQ